MLFLTPSMPRWARQWQAASTWVWQRRSGEGILAWGVFAPSEGPEPGRLRANMLTVGAGVGANVLVGSQRSITLQPLSVQAQTGLALAGGQNPRSRILPQTGIHLCVHLASPNATALACTGHQTGAPFSSITVFALTARKYSYALKC